MKRTGPAPTDAGLVKGRLRGRCLRCRQARGEQIHHRRPRGLGGSRLPETNRPDNLVYICADCHRRIETNRAEAYSSGWLLRHTLEQPSEVPLTDLAGRVLFLTEEGELVYVTPSEGPLA